ncbi:hypothetical protein PL75_04490 [Neisseria arctica]|uniref:Autotransporter domain-containing protein n=1 Tax=Neisseria arctica TaxID=1470200 RepID=A0A0J1C4B4_9NEIS|nr:autotransporter domain-containing protein [Neisseria arctica]KLT73168.1 hypothetical protein PL75_04490 [Neisseria arctica]UOO87099.1 autotransporter domain-containing protein [Neisseria arctica]
MKRTLIAAWIAALPVWAVAQDTVVFGDSLSDIGQPGWALKATYTDETGQPHRLYGEIVAESLGSKLVASGAGGTDYAYSGGVVVGSNSERTAAQPNLALQTQVDNYLVAGVKKDALHILWGGGNDMAAILERAQSSASPALSAAVDIAAAAQASGKQLQSLKNAGVDLVVMPNVPNVVYTPTLFESFAAAAAASVNKQVSGALIAAGQDAQQAAATAGMVAAQFTQAFQTASASLATSKQTSLADFENARVAVLNDTVEKLYATPIGAALTAAGVGKAAFSAGLQAQYQTFSTSAADATGRLNNETNTAIGKVGGNVVRLDTNQLFTDILNNPAAYGFNNTTVPVCSSSTAQTLCSPANAAEADSRLFADSFHPGPKAHQIMADYLLSTLQAPQEIAGLGRTALSGSLAAADFIREESRRSRKQPPRTLDAIAAYNHNGDDGQTVYAGAKVQFDPQWQAGVMVGRQNVDSRYGQTEIGGRAHHFGAYLRYDMPRAWVGGLLQIGDADYTTRRSIVLGQNRISQQAESGGRIRSAGLFGGYDVWRQGDTRIAALGDLTLSSGKVNAVNERSGGATQMQFAEQNIRSLRSGLGLEAKHTVGNLTPFANVRWVKEWKNNQQQVTATLNGSSFTLPVADEDRSWINGQLGVVWQPKERLRFHTALGRDFAREGSSNTSVRVGVGMLF